MIFLEIRNFVMAPPDTRRITGPESSRDYRIFVPKDCVKTSTSKADLQKRPDGRAKDDDHRTVCETFIKNFNFL